MFVFIDVDVDAVVDAADKVDTVVDVVGTVIDAVVDVDVDDVVVVLALIVTLSLCFNPQWTPSTSVFSAPVLLPEEASPVAKKSPYPCLSAVSAPQQALS